MLITGHNPLMINVLLCKDQKVSFCCCNKLWMQDVCGEKLRSNALCRSRVVAFVCSDRRGN